MIEYIDLYHNLINLYFLIEFTSEKYTGYITV